MDYTPHEVAELLQNDGIQLIDIRQPEERDAGRIAGDRFIALAQLAAQVESIDRERPGPSSPGTRRVGSAPRRWH